MTAGAIADISNASVYMVRAAIYSACNFITIMSLSTAHCYTLLMSAVA